MKNSECTIYIMFKDRAAEVPKRKRRLERIQLQRIVRSCSAEQFISHILPPLAGIKGPDVTVKVEPDKVEKSA